MPRLLPRSLTTAAATLAAGAAFTAASAARAAAIDHQCGIFLDLIDGRVIGADCDAA
ncbi:hypothetical protein GCM10027168_10850 [Streptomyces capparidis]